MPVYKLLFLAPFDFDPAVMELYRHCFNMDCDAGDAEVIVCDPSADYMFDMDRLEKYPKLKVLATPSTGINHIDIQACIDRKVNVISLLDGREHLEHISASAEFTFKLLLDALRLEPPRELMGKTIGIVGYGRIGRRIEKWCEAFDAWTVKNDPMLTMSMELQAMFKICDAVILCCTLNEGSRGLVTKELLESMKPGAALINVSRGEVVDEDALAEVMRKRPDLRVAVDVLVGMEKGQDNPERLKELGAIVTPHTAGRTFESRTKAALIILRLLEERLP